MGIQTKNRAINVGRIIKITIILLLSIGPIYFMSMVGRAYNVYTIFNAQYTDECIVPMERFMAPNPERVAIYADKFESLMVQYNMPSNLTGDGWDYYVHTNTFFKRNPKNYGIRNATDFTDYCDPLDTEHILNEIDNYNLGGHDAVYSGYTGMGEALRYACAIREGNDTALEASRQHLLHIVKAYDLLSSVTPDGMMARMVVPNTTKARELCINDIFQESYNRSHIYFPINYTFDGKNYSFYCETGTSVDCYMVYNALGMIYAMCNDTEIRTIVRSTVDRMIEFHVDRGWRFVDYDGKTHSAGAEAMTGAPITDPMYALAFLRTGKTCNPDRWGSLYDSFVYSRLLNKKVGRHAKWDLFAAFIWGGSYFNVNMAMTIAGTLCFLEDDPRILDYYREHFLEPVHDITKYHRNAWFDVLYYLGMTDIDFSCYENAVKIPDKEDLHLSSEWQAYIDASVGDCLLRLTYTKYPYRQFSYPNGLESYDDHTYWTHIPGAPYPDAEIYDWESTVNTYILAVNLFTQLLPPLEQWTEAIPTDWYPSRVWMWEWSPFTAESGGENSKKQCMPGSFTSPYWIGRFLNLTSISTL